MQLKDKNDSVQLSTRYGQYCFAKRHSRGTSRPEVFPFGHDSKETDGVSGQHSNTLTARYYGGQANGMYVVESELNAQETAVRGTEDGFHTYRNDKKKSSVQGTHVTYPEGKSHCLNTAHIPLTIEQLNNPTHSNDRVYGEDGISPTLNTMQGGNRQPFVKVPEATSKGYAEAEVNDMKIRRLTPTECERLQGFPDGWTKYGGYKKAADIISKNPEHGGAFEVISDSQRYKMCGNAVTVNVISDIMEKLL